MIIDDELVGMAGDAGMFVPAAPDSAPADSAPAAGSMLAASIAAGAGTSLMFGVDSGAATLSFPVPFANPIVLMDDIHVAGTTHVENIRELVERLQPGTQLTFKREKENPYDNQCIRVDFEGEKVGFVPRSSNDIPARLMDGGKQICGEIVDVEMLPRWIKIHMKVVLKD